MRTVTTRIIKTVIPGTDDLVDREAYISMKEWLDCCMIHGRQGLVINNVKFDDRQA